MTRNAARVTLMLGGLVALLLLVFGVWGAQDQHAAAQGVGAGGASLDAAPVSSGPPQVKDERGAFHVSTWQVEIPAQPLKLHCKTLKTDVNGADLECMVQP